MPAGDRDRSLVEGPRRRIARRDQQAESERDLASTGSCSISIPHHCRGGLPTLGEARGFVEVQLKI
jgi:hypothetical protein